MPPATKMTKYSVVAEKEEKCSQFRLCYIFQIFLFLFIFVCILVGLIAILYPAKYTPVLTLEDGPIQGSVAYSRDGLEYWQYLGIPYAKPPVGKLAYAPPQNPDKWEEVRSATEYPPPCVQFDALVTARVKGKMDCLYVNVFVNKAESENVTLPVLVHIYGGGFISGSSDMYQPDYLMDEKIIVITFNYRLGPYGYLNLGNDSLAPGNVALLDQSKVLKWVQKNIGHFGGDPKRVTLMGESAGAVASHLHLLSPISNGLFQKAIILSGNGLAKWSFTREPLKLAKTFAKNIGCNDTRLDQCYANLEKGQLASQQSLMDPLAEDDLFRPSVDGHFLKDTPENIFKSGQFPDIPVMFGVSDAEGVIRSGRFAAMPELIEKLDKEWDSLVADLLLLDRPVLAEKAQAIRKQYFGNASFTDDQDAFLRNMTNLMSDVGFFLGVHKSAVLHAKRGAPVYAYYFNYTSKFYPGAYTVFRSVRMDSWIPSELSLAWYLTWDWIKEYIFGGNNSHLYGVGHGEDCYQFWNMIGLGKYFSWFDKDFSKSAVKALVDFVYDTEPLSFRGVSWPVINYDLQFGKNEHLIPFMLMDNEPTARVVPEPFADKIKFWEKLEL